MSQCVPRTRSTGSSLQRLHQPCPLPTVPFHSPAWILLFSSQWIGLLPAVALSDHSAKRSPLSAQGEALTYLFSYVVLFVFVFVLCGGFRENVFYVGALGFVLFCFCLFSLYASWNLSSMPDSVIEKINLTFV